MAAEHGVSLTNEEIWDDSALVDSWNSALEEYKKYHSIHTKGGNVAELLKAKKADADSQAADVKENSIDDQTKDADGHSAETAVPNDQQVGNGTNEKIQSTGAPIMAPETILGSVHDEGLKRLLMSWYYAGYYTGLHEGRSNQNGPGQG